MPKLKAILPSTDHEHSVLLTLGQALNAVLRGGYRRLDIDFTDADGKNYTVQIYTCKTYVRADFKPVKEA